MSIQREVSADALAAANACAEHILDRLDDALSARGDATLAVSGGSTPKLLFQAMARRPFNWNKVHLFWVDERCVLPTDSQSNYKLAHDYFIGPASFPNSNVHRVIAELPPQKAADQYASDIRNFFGVPPGEMPQFDVIHCGMGPDCHTASLFPGEPLIDDRHNLTAAVYAEKMKSWRVTLLPGVLLAARDLIVLAAGDDKAVAVRNVFEQPFDPKKYPAQLTTRARGGICWFLDKAAASQIEK